MWKLNLEIDKILPKKEDIKFNDFSDGLIKLFSCEKNIIKIQIEKSILNIPIVYGFSDILEVLLFEILNDLVYQKEGENLLYGFPQDSYFDGDWELSWAQDNLEINFFWRSIFENDISKFPKKIITSKKIFIESWFSLFREFLKYIKDEDVKDDWESEQIFQLMLNHNKNDVFS